MPVTSNPFLILEHDHIYIVQRNAKCLKVVVMERTSLPCVADRIWLKIRSCSEWVKKKERNSAATLGFNPNRLVLVLKEEEAEPTRSGECEAHDIR